MHNFEAITSHFNGLDYDEQNLALMVISYKLYYSHPSLV